MRISDARVVVCSPGRNYVTLVVETEDGLTGLGDATLNGRELAVASYLRDYLCPLLIGRDGRRIEDTWQYLYRSAGSSWRRWHVHVAMCSTPSYSSPMSRMIAQRELRNDNAKVIEAVTAGETFVVTRNGEPVAELRPLQAGRRRFISREELAVLASANVRIDRDRFRADLDDVIDQRV